MKTLLFFLFFLFALPVLAQEPVKDSTFFLTQEYFQTLGMKRVEANQVLRVYTKSDVDASMNRLVDIRWVFNTAEEAKKYYSANLKLQSEGGYEYKKQLSLPNAKLVKIYREERGSAAMYETFGSQHVHWYFIFLVDRVMVKIFTSGKFTSFNEAYSIAWDAAQMISEKLKLPVNGISKPDFSQQPDTVFSSKIRKEKIAFNYPPGFETGKIPSTLKRYFDQELSFPGEEYVLRYYIVPTNGAALRSDTLSYDKYCREKDFTYLSVSLNIMMGTPGDMPATRQLKDTVKCKKMFNGDYLISSFFEVGKKSELAKGYKYCLMYAIYKKGHADCYVVYLTNNQEMLTAFPQLVFQTLKYPKVD